MKIGMWTNLRMKHRSFLQILLLFISFIIGCKSDDKLNGGVEYSWTLSSITFSNLKGNDISPVNDLHKLRIVNNSDDTLVIKCSRGVNKSLFTLRIFDNNTLWTIPLITGRDENRRILPGDTSYIILATSSFSDKIGTTESETTDSCTKLLRKAIVTYYDNDFICFNKTKDYDICVSLRKKPKICITEDW